MKKLAFVLLTGLLASDFAFAGPSSVISNCDGVYGTTPCDICSPFFSKGVGKLAARRRLSELGYKWDTEKFLDTIFQGDAQATCLFIEAGMSASEKTWFGETPIFMAAKTGRLNFASYLVAKGADPDYQNTHIGAGNFEGLNTQQATPLMFAVWGGHTAMVEFLLEHGANPERKNAAGDTALSFAERKGNVKITELLKGHYRQILPDAVAGGG